MVAKQFATAFSSVFFFVANTETSVTLSKFAADLEPWADKLSLMSQVHKAGIVRSETENAAHRVWLLLTALQETMDAEYQQGMHKEQKVRQG